MLCWNIRWVSGETDGTSWMDSKFAREESELLRSYISLEIEENG